MKYYPVFLDLKDKYCLVVGGGKVAERKIRTLLECDAKVKIVAKELTSWVDSAVTSGEVKYLGENFEPSQVAGASLVIAATSDRELNRQVAREADRRQIWCNVVDQPEDCSFILPSIVVRGDLTIAISTSGQSPALAKKIREELEKKFGEEYETFTRILGRVRKKVLEKYSDEQERKKIFTSLVESNIVDLLKKKDWARIDSVLTSILDHEFTLDKLGFRGNKA